MKQTRQEGFTLIELIVSAVLLMTVMTLTTTLCFRVNQIWKDIGHQQVAVAELSNQLEILTRLAPDELSQAIESLEPSVLCTRTLFEPSIKGQVNQDNLGTRITLQINWQRRFPGQPVELSGWLIAPPTAETQSAKSNPSKDSEQSEETNP